MAHGVWSSEGNRESVCIAVSNGIMTVSNVASTLLQAPCCKHLVASIDMHLSVSAVHIVEIINRKIDKSIFIILRYSQSEDISSF